MSPLLEDDRIISLVEFANLLDLSLMTAKRMRARGELPIVKLSPRRIGLRTSAVRQWLREREATA